MSSASKLLLNLGADGPAWSAVGDTYVILASGDDTAGACCLLEAIIPPEGGPPMHLHEREDESFYVLEGEVTFTAGERSVTAGSGSFVQLPKGTPHCFKNNSNAPVRMLIQCVPAGFDRFMQEFAHPLPSRRSPPVPPTPADIKKLLAVAPKYGIRILAGEAM